MSVALLAGVLLAGLVAVPGGPAGAQDIADLPRLGFEINPTQGNVGDLVEGQVDTDDIQEHCLDWVPPGTEDLPIALMETWVDIAEEVFLGFGFEGPFYFGEERLADVNGALIEDPDFQSFYRTWVTFMIGGMVDSEIRGLFFSSTFVMTFVDPVTQELLGDLGGFDPITGQGSVTVPDIEPSLYAVVAACLFPSSAEEQVFGGGLDRGYAAFLAYLDENYPDREGIPFYGSATLNIQDPAWGEFVGDVAPIWLQEVLDIQAVGIDFYCILQPDGFCATPPGPVGLITDDVIDEFNGDGPGDELLSPADDGPGDAGDLVAVQAAPSFTG